MTTQIPTAPPSPPTDAELKARHRTMWGLGDYPAVARDIVGPLGEVLVASAGVKAGQHGVDVAAGTGNATLAAARVGADVVGVDLVPALLEEGRQRAEAEGLTVRWREGDAEHLPCEDGEHDFVLSCIGVMFAPHHQEAADELVRVCAPGGTIGVLSWTPEGFIGQLFATMKAYVPPPPAGVSPPPLWGRPDHVTELFGDRVKDVHVHRGLLVVDHFATAEEFRDYFKTTYGPTIVAYKGLADDPERTAALDADLADLGRRFAREDGVMDWEYLVVTATRV